MATKTMDLGGMPTHEGDLSIEGRGIEPIPESARYGSVNRVFTVWFTPNLVPAAFFIGLLAAAGFLQVGFTTGLLAIVVGNLIGAALVGRLAGDVLSARTGSEGQCSGGDQGEERARHRCGFLHWLRRIVVIGGSVRDATASRPPANPAIGTAAVISRALIRSDGRGRRQTRGCQERWGRQRRG